MIKKFRIKIKLEEVIEDELSSLFPLFSNSQMCVGIDQIKTTMEILEKRLNEFIDTTLKLNDKKE